MARAVVGDKHVHPTVLRELLAVSDPQRVAGPHVGETKMEMAIFDQQLVATACRIERGAGAMHDHRPLFDIRCPEIEAQREWIGAGKGAYLFERELGVAVQKDSLASGALDLFGPGFSKPGFGRIGTVFEFAFLKTLERVVGCWLGDSSRTNVLPPCVEAVARSGRGGVGGQFRFGRLDVAAPFEEFLPLCGGAEQQGRYRHGVGFRRVDARFVNIVEKTTELKKLFLGYRIVLVGVAAGALEGQPEQSGAYRDDAVGNIFGTKFFGDRAALFVLAMQAVKGGCQPLLVRRIWKQIAGKLPGDKFVEGHVFVHGPHHPVAPGPDIPVAVDLISRGIGVAGQIEPGARHADTVAG